jgi:hypothetical protein
MLGCQRVTEPAVSDLHGWQALTILGVKGNTIVRIDVAVEKSRDLGWEAEGFV